MKSKLWNKILNHPNLTIVAVGVVLSVIFYLVAAATRGLVSSLLTNLSAGMIGVVLIVILVDALRNLSVKKKREPSQKEAIRLIKASHINLVMVVATSKYRKEFADAFIKAGNSMNEGSYNALSDVTSEYAVRLAAEKPADLLKDFNQKMIDNLRTIVSKLSDGIKDTRANYSFAIDDALNERLSEMMQGLNFTSGAFSSFDLTASNLSSFTDAPPEMFVGIGLHTYLEAYKKLLEKYE